MVFSPFPRSWRFVSLALATACTTAFIVLDFPLAFTATGYVAMYLLLAYRNEFIIDATKRIYVWRDGVWPLMGQRHGALSDLRWVSVDAYEQPSPDDGPAQDPPLQLVVSVEWNPQIGARPYPITQWRDFAASAQIALEIAQVADIPVVENSILRTRRPKLGPAPYDVRILVPVNDRPRSLAARLRG